MPKGRGTTIGLGAFGRHAPVDRHADETLRRVLRAGRPLTEDAMPLALRNVLRHNNRSTVFQKVRQSRDGGGNR